MKKHMNQYEVLSQVADGVAELASDVACGVGLPGTCEYAAELSDKRISYLQEERYRVLSTTPMNKLSREDFRFLMDRSSFGAFSPELTEFAMENNVHKSLTVGGIDPKQRPMQKNSYLDSGPP